ncbi:MAG: four helix bundle protein [Bacteroidota bacterium]
MNDGQGIYAFEKLKTWQKANSLSIAVYRLTNAFPASERYGLIPQMRRASISIQSNIAEGSARITKKDQSHFYTMSFSSLMELLNQLILSKDLGMLTEEEYQQIRTELSLVAKLLNGLRKSLK